MDHLSYYDLIWRLVAGREGRPALFGEDCAPLARQAFASCAAGSTMPIVYLEIPLAGEAGFDLQVCMNREALMGGAQAPAGAPEHARELIAWLAGPGGADCQGIDLAFDVRARNLESPQLIVLMEDGTLADAERFFELTGTPDGAARYRAAEARMPKGWKSWYTGVCPQRPDAPVRLDYFVDHDTLAAYRRDAHVLARDLAQTGYAFSAQEVRWCEQLLQHTSRLNLQLDVLSNGSIGPVVGYNLIGKGLWPRKIRSSLEGGWMRRVLELAEAWGVADERWRLLEDLCQAKVCALPQDNATKQLIVSIKPTFIKLRMTPEALIDAKAYVICVLNELA